jgi:hypothetical protein
VGWVSELRRSKYLGRWIQFWSPLSRTPCPVYMLMSMAVNDIILVVYLICTVSDKTGMDKILFLLGHRIWIWIRKKFR